MSEAITITDIRAAAERLKGAARVTPLLEADTLNEFAGRRVLVKAECLQRTGSFKFRGGWSAISAQSEDARAKGVIGYSSGNHAQGVALTARELGLEAVIVMPVTTPQIKVDAVRSLGAEAILHGDDFNAAFEQAQHLLNHQFHYYLRRLK